MHSFPWSKHSRRILLIVLAILTMIGLWPNVLAPLGRAYVLLCARFLTDAPFRHHFPPLLVAFAGLVFLCLATGFAVALARQVAGQRQLNAKLTSCRCEPEAQICEILASLDVKERTIITHDTERAYAFCSGLVQPKIYLSSGLLHLLAPAEIEAVVRHELHHLQQRDPLRLFLGSLGVRLACIMPILTTLDRRLRIRIELAADREVVLVMGVEALATALIKVARASPAIDHRVVTATFSSTEARIAALLGDDVKMPFSWQDLVTSTLFLTSLLTLSTWLALQSLPLPPECLVCSPF